MLFLKSYYIDTTDDVDIISIIHELNYAIRDSKSPEGLLTAIVPAGSAALSIFTPTDEVMDELKVTMEVFGSEAGKTKDRLKREKEVGPIIQGLLLGRSVQIPFKDSKLIIDPYDEVFLIDFEKEIKRREVVVQIISEAPEGTDEDQTGKQGAAGSQQTEKGTNRG